MNRVKLVSSVAILVAMIPLAGICVERNIEIEVSARLASSYVWRGRVMNEGGVLQPEVKLRLEDLSGSLMGTWEWENRDEDPDRSRVDGTVAYGATWDLVRASGGLVARIYNDAPAAGRRDTYEVFVDLLFDTTLYPAVTLYYDFGEGEGLYGEFSVAHGFTVSERVDVLLKAKIGAATDAYNHYLFGDFPADGVVPEGATPPTADKTGLVDFSFTIAVPIQAAPQLTVTPRVEYTALLDSAIRDVVSANGGKADSVVGSVAATWRF